MRWPEASNAATYLRMTRTGAILFSDCLSFLLEDTETSCFAWTMLPNHIHILIRPSKEKLATFMRRLLTCYAVTFNLRHGRSGHLFQNRYKSIICEEDTYLLGISHGIRKDLNGNIKERDTALFLSVDARILGAREFVEEKSLLTIGLRPEGRSLR